MSSISTIIIYDHYRLDQEKTAHEQIKSDLIAYISGASNVVHADAKTGSKMVAVFEKIANNGTRTCDEYCGHDERGFIWEERMGTCVGAFLLKTNEPTSCRTSSKAGEGIRCLCSAF